MTSTDLRMRVVEAGARAIAEMSMVDRYDETMVADAALDAMLDCLAEEAPTRDVSDLIWMLRDDPDDWRKYQGHVSPMPPSLREDR